jgi:hypothetical protein
MGRVGRSWIVTAKRLLPVSSSFLHSVTHSSAPPLSNSETLFNPKRQPPPAHGHRLTSNSFPDQAFSCSRFSWAECRGKASFGAEKRRLEGRFRRDLGPFRKTIWQNTAENELSFQMGAPFFTKVDCFMQLIYYASRDPRRIGGRLAMAMNSDTNLEMHNPLGAVASRFRRTRIDVSQLVHQRLPREVRCESTSTACFQIVS